RQPWFKPPSYPCRLVLVAVRGAFCRQANGSLADSGGLHSSISLKHWRMMMTNVQKLCIGLLVLIPAWSQTAGQVEPNAGNWKTWFISSGKDFRVPPPPDAATTKTELDWLRGLVAEKDPRIAAQVAFWDAGSPTYRWIDLIGNRILDGRLASGQPALRA